MNRKLAPLKSRKWLHVPNSILWRNEKKRNIEVVVMSYGPNKNLVDKIKDIAEQFLNYNPKKTIN